MNSHRTIPNLHIVVGACIIAVVGYGFFSIYAVVWLGDATMTGDIIGTWKSFAVAAIMFWLGSSSGGKQQSDVEPTGTRANPTIIENTGTQDVTVVNPPHDPVQTEDAKR